MTFSKSWLPEKLKTDFSEKLESDYEPSDSFGDHIRDNVYSRIGYDFISVLLRDSVGRWKK